MLTSKTKETILWFIGVGLTTFLILVMALPADKARDQANRQPTTVDARRPASQLEKSRGGPVRIQLDVLKSRDIREGRLLDLKATVKITQDPRTELRYAWVLPEGTELAQGDARGALLIDDGAVTVLASVLVSAQALAENRQMGLHVFRKVGGEFQGEISHISVQDTSQNDAAALHRSSKPQGHSKATLHLQNETNTGFRVYQ